MQNPIEASFNPHYTFDALVVGNHNQLAHTASLAAAQSPGKSYNPLFIYGGVGLGKTHLLQAIGQELLTARPGARVTYVTTERFTNEFIDALRKRTLGSFRKKYRQTAALLMDDAHFLAGKERIQEEFFHTFNALHENGRQVVLACDRPAGEIRRLDQRLVSRFEWGLVAQLQPPDEENRRAILRKKLDRMNVSLPADVLQFIAQRVRNNIRRLEGALVRVTSYVALTSTPPTVPLAEGLLRDLLHEDEHHALTIETIQKQVADRFEIGLFDMTSKRRPEKIAFPRQVAMFLARQITQSSLNTIGEAFGGRDHGTVLHACRSVKDRMEVDPQVRQIVQQLEEQMMP